jgi:hypothetical protein
MTVTVGGQNAQVRAVRDPDRLDSKLMVGFQLPCPLRDEPQIMALSRG